MLVIGSGKSAMGACALLKKLKKKHLLIESLDNTQRSILERTDSIIIPPGISPKHPFLEVARNKDIEIIGEISLGLRYLKNPTIAITGTNGKTTTALLCKHVLKNNRITSKVLGNIGYSLCEYLSKPHNEKEPIILELSSYQIESIKKACFQAALILNISPHHLDRYNNFQHYVSTKLSLLKQTNNPFISQQVFDITKYPVPIFDNEKVLYHHNMISEQSIKAAHTLTKIIGCNKFDTTGFLKPPFRLEYLGQKNGVLIYNDSKSSNTTSTMFALNMLPRKVHLIFGGKAATTDYTQIKWPSNLRSLLTFGETTEAIKDCFKNCFTCFTIKRALKTALLVAKKNEVILFSPGHTSYDQFKNFEERGQYFNKITRELMS